MQALFALFAISLLYFFVGHDILRNFYGTFNFNVYRFLIFIKKKKSYKEEPVDDNNSYLLYNDNPPVTATTSSIQISDHYQVPLSRVVQENLSANNDAVMKFNHTDSLNF